MIMDRDAKMCKFETEKIKKLVLVYSQRGRVKKVKQ